MNYERIFFSGCSSARLISNVMIPIVFPSGTDVILSGIAHMEKMKMTVLILNVRDFFSVPLNRNVCHILMYVITRQIARRQRLMSTHICVMIKGP